MKRLRLILLNPVFVSLLIMATTLGVTALTSPGTAVAQASTTACDSGTFFGIPPWHKYVQKDATKGCTLVLDFPNDLWLIVFGIIDILLRLSAYIAVGFIIFGSIRLVMSQGEPEGVKGAKDTITNAVIGLIITLLSVTLVSFVARSFN